jgi:polysaccharide export outer membrane protein
MNIRNLAIASLLVLGIVSCAPPQKITYFGGLPQGEIRTMAESAEIRLKPQDKVTIVVKSKDPVLSNLFNLPITQQIVGYTEQQALMQSNYSAAYTIDGEGNIDFPIVGSLHVAGMTRNEVGQAIKSVLLGKQYLKDAVVTVEYANLRLSVLGEVKDPGQFVIDRDKITILDALSKAGDMTIYGRRDSVTVLRDFGDRQYAYKVDLSSDSLFRSPAYYLQQNDIVYVSPNNYRQRQATVNGNQLTSASFWLSLISVLTTVGVLLFK